MVFDVYILCDKYWRCCETFEKLKAKKHLPPLCFCYALFKSHNIPRVYITVCERGKTFYISQLPREQLNFRNQPVKLNSLIDIFAK